jgi:hypothetical protein
MTKVEIKNKTFYFNDTATPKQILAYFELNLWILDEDFDLFNESHSIEIELQEKTLIFKGDEDYLTCEIETIKPVF